MCHCCSLLPLRWDTNFSGVGVVGAAVDPNLSATLDSSFCSVSDHVMMIHTSSSTRLDYCNFHILDCALGIWINTCWYREQSSVSGKKGLDLPTQPSPEHISGWPAMTLSSGLPHQLAYLRGCRQGSACTWSGCSGLAYVMPCLGQNAWETCKAVLHWNHALLNEENLPQRDTWEESKIIQACGMVSLKPAGTVMIDCRVGQAMRGQLAFEKPLCFVTLPVKYVLFILFLQQMLIEQFLCPGHYSGHWSLIDIYQ